MKVILVLLVCAATAFAAPQRDHHSRSNYGGLRPGKCEQVRGSDGTYSFECNFVNHEDGVISRDDVLWLDANGKGADQYVEIKLPNYLFQQAITGAVRGGRIEGENHILVKLPAPHSDLTAYKQEDGITVVSKPNVNFEYEAGSKQGQVHYSTKDGNLRTLDRPLVNNDYGTGSSYNTNTRTTGFGSSGSVGSTGFGSSGFGSSGFGSSGFGSSGSGSSGSGSSGFGSTGNFRSTSGSSRGIGSSGSFGSGSVGSTQSGTSNFGSSGGFGSSGVF